MNKESRIQHNYLQLWQTNCIRLFSLFIILYSFASCEPDTNCHQDLDVRAKITLQADSITFEGDTISYTQWDSILVVGVGSDIGLQDKNIQMMGLELRPDSNLTAYLMLYHNQVDTLYIQHTPRQQFISMACGCAVYHTITATWSTDTRIDSVSIINASVELATEENLRIYLHE